MDRPLPVSRNTLKRRIWRNARAGLLLFAIVIGVGMLPIAILYFFMPTDEHASASESRPGRVKQPPTKADPMVAFVNVNVIPMDSERVLASQTVIVREGRIAEIGPADQVKVPAGALRVDGAGKYLIPGLADLHVHLDGYDDETNHALLQLLAVNGVTTVLNLHGVPGHLKLREEVASRRVFGPTIYTSGPFISDAPRQMPSAAQVERAVVEQKRAGYDIIKIHGDFSREAYHKLFEVARSQGIRVIGHAPRNLGAAAMIEERQDAVAHAEEYLYSYFFFNQKTPPRGSDIETKNRFMREQEARIAEIARDTAKAGTWVVANLTAYKTIGLQAADINSVLGRAETKYVPPKYLRDWQPENNTYVRRFKGEETVRAFRAQYGLLEKLVRGFRDSGVRLLAGTDTPIPSIVPGFSIHDELRYFVEAGLTPYESLRAATANAAEFLEARDSGVIAPGNRADLLLLDANPLVDISSTIRSAGVMLHGRWVPRDEVKKILKDLLASYGKRE
jgi:imidazolonepropionase-like amidohydrolase